MYLHFLWRLNEFSFSVPTLIYKYEQGNKCFYNASLVRKFVIELWHQPAQARKSGENSWSTLWSVLRQASFCRKNDICCVIEQKVMSFFLQKKTKNIYGAKLIFR